MLDPLSERCSRYRAFIPCTINYAPCLLLTTRLRSLHVCCVFPLVHSGSHVCHILRQTALRSQFGTCHVQAFGSSVSGLGFHGCDLDLYAHIDAQSPGCGLEPEADQKKKVRVVAKILEQVPQLCKRIIRIPNARVPIIKFSVPRLGIQCDMSFKNQMSCQNSRLIKFLMKAGQ